MVKRGTCGWAWGGQVGRVQRLNSKVQGFSGCLLGRGRILALTIQITLGVRVRPSVEIKGQGGFQVKFEAQVRLGVTSVEGFRGWARLLGALTGGPRGVDEQGWASQLDLSSKVSGHGV